MDVFDEELLKIWTVFFRNKVEYIMVGGFAVNLHGYQRFTGDMDLWINDTLENRKRLRKSFVEIDLGDIEMIETMPFIAGWTDFRVSNFLTIDLMSTLKGLEQIGFDECYHLASLATIEGVEVRFLHINHLIRSKEASNRPKDKLDLQELEKIKTLRNQSNIKK
jgi:hypothetical protein